MKKNKSVRLPGHIVPVEYDIKLKPDLRNFTFEGTESITLSASKNFKRLTLHSKEIDIETASLEMDDNLPHRQARKIFTGKITYNKKAETATFLFPKLVKVKPSQAKRMKLILTFKGILNDKMRGFYRSRYICDGKECYLATTQFEATDARRAFPCFDEPARKAVFHVSLFIPKGHTAISNTLPVSVAEHESGIEMVRFEPTPKMSTYLLACIVGNFEHIETKTKRGVLVRVFTTPGKVHQARFALDCAARMLDFYEKYFDIKYPLPALDLIAIPDFQAGAMENWGAITYRESAILFDEKHTSAHNRQWIALVIAHELAHQWFGNLVTMEWWTHLWLNEGFASYIEYLAVDKLFPEWNIWTQFSTHDQGVGLRLDALLDTHPIEVEVRHPDEIGEIFDEISYSKGASVIRMLADYLGEKDFRDGLRYYLSKHSYRNAKTVHLWQAFEKVSGKPVGRIMREWTKKPGYPLVRADIKNEVLYLSQERFFASPLSKKKSKDRTVWQVPIVTKSAGYSSAPHRQSMLFLSRSTVRPAESGARSFLRKSALRRSASWYKLNSGESGFFRVAYSPEMLSRLAGPVSSKKLSACDRLGIIRDLFALSEAGEISAVEALRFLENYKKEDDYAVWLEIITSLSKLEQIFFRSRSEKLLARFTINLLRPLLARLGWRKKKEEPYSDTLLRPLVIKKLGLAGNKEVVEKSKKIFSKTNQGKHIDPDLRSAVYSTAARAGGVKEYRMLQKMHEKTEMHEEKNRLESAMGEFASGKILTSAARFALSKRVRPQDTLSMLATLAGNPHGRDAWFSCMRENWNTLVSRYGEGGHTLHRLVKSISGTAEARHLRFFKKFFKTHPAPGAERAVRQVAEKIESNILWRKRDEKNIRKFLIQFLIR